MEIILCDLSWEVVLAWQHAFAGTKVRVQQGSILAVDCDAIVSPANSFGVRDGGLDLVYSQHFGWEVEERVREELRSQWYGELPVGNAVIVPIAGRGVQWMISAPTMRVPCRVDQTTNAYLAFRAVLIAIQAHNAGEAHQQIRRVACPGLGTGEGRMPPDRCARQMRYAHDAVLNGAFVTKGGLAGAVRNHIELLR